MKKRINEIISRDFMFGFEYVEYLIQQYFPNENINRKGMSVLLDWAYTNIVEDNDTPRENKIEENNNIKNTDITNFEDWYTNVLYPSFVRREKDYLLYWGKNNANNNLLNIDVTSKAFGANDNFHLPISKEDQINVSF